MLQRLMRATIAVTLVAVSAGSVVAQEVWPKAKPIKWLIGVPPGGGLDPVTRSVADRLSQRLGATIIIENKPGANQALAAADAVKAEPDGYTLLSVAGPTLYSRPVPEIGRGLDPVAVFSRGPVILAGTTKTDTLDLQSLLKAVKDKPESWSYGTAGVASIHHIAGELISERAGVTLKHVPYRGGGSSINDAVGGHIPLLTIGVGPVIPQIEAGTLRGYGVMGRERFPLLPMVPTMEQAGLPGAELGQFFGVAIRSGAPAEIVARLNLEINAVLATDDVKTYILKQGAVAQQLSSAEWGALYLALKAEVTAIAKRRGIEVGE